MGGVHIWNPQRAPALMQGTTRSLESALLLGREQTRTEGQEEDVSASSNTTKSDTDGDELAVELARIANDVKV